MKDTFKTTQSFSPSRVTGLAFPAVTIEQVQDWVEKVNAQKNEHKPAQSLELRWHDPVSKKEWKIHNLSSLRYKSLEELREIHGNHFDYWMIGRPNPDLRPYGEQSLTLKSLRCYRAVLLPNGTYALFSMAANFDLCDLFYYDWRLKDEYSST
ncbi:MAG: hypothetical protein ACK5O7_05210 [Holosporales bacterium]